MLVGEIRNQIDSIWDDFWSGGVSNPLSVMEQITYLLFIKRLDELQSVEEAKATTLGKPLERRIFPAGKDPRGMPYDRLRWSRFKAEEPREMFRILDEHVFPFIREKVAADERVIVKRRSSSTLIFRDRPPDSPPEGKWWAVQGSNLWPLPCQGSALPLS
jgi:hypothetical protein